jgi:hypothetical protein
MPGSQMKALFVILGLLFGFACPAMAQVTGTGDLGAAGVLSDTDTMTVCQTARDALEAIEARPSRDIPDCSSKIILALSAISSIQALL